MSWHRIHRLGLIVGIVTLVAAACGGTSNTPKTNWATATSAASGGGMDALVAAAKAEGNLNVIALPHNWTNYGEIISSFKAKYGIAINEISPNDGSQQEVDKITSMGTRGPDVVDVGTAVVLKSTALFAPYQVSTWKDIPDSQKESTGLWYQDYGGFMAIGYDSAKVPAITGINDLLGSAFKGKVALPGNALLSNQAVNSIMAVSLANGGSLDNIGPGVDWFKTLKKNKNWVPVIGTTATVKAGATPVLFEWSYNAVTHVNEVPTWKVYLPGGQVVGSYYNQAVSKTAAHPAAARLWEEFLYSDTGQNLYLKGAGIPVRLAAMTTAGTLDKAALAALPPVNGTPVFMSSTQSTAASAYLASHWAAAIG
jgi:putative spermidine/putrescine transport system substrate-binding protein